LGALGLRGNTIEKLVSNCKTKRSCYFAVVEPREGERKSRKDSEKVTL